MSDPRLGIYARHVEITDGCWTWLASTVNGYGRIKTRGKTTTAHRVVYELLVGPIPKGLTLAHLCRNRLCVNPAHMEPVTRGENVRRGDAVTAKNARKDRCHRGHLFTISNTHIEAKSGSRRCKECSRLRELDYRNRPGGR